MRGAICTRVDQQPFSGDIVARVRSLIDDALAVIVDLSESKPNVLYELGYAHGIQRPTVHICSTSLADLPFDIRNWNTIRYEPGRTHALREPLEQALRAAIESP